MIFSRMNFLIGQFVKKTTGSYANGVVHLTERFSEVTNGHWLIRVHVPEQDGEIPSAPGLRPYTKKRFEMKLTESSAADIVRELDRNKKNYGDMGMNGKSWVTKQFKEAAVVFGFVGPKGPKGIAADGEEMKFPNTDAVMKLLRRKPKLRVGLSPEYLRTMCDVFQKAGATAMVFSFYGDDKALKIETVNCAETHVEAILMPMKVEPFVAPKKGKVAPPPVEVLEEAGEVSDPEETKVACEEERVEA